MSKLIEKNGIRMIRLDRVRLSFPALFKRETFEGKEGKFAATALIPKTDKATKSLLDAEIARAIKESKVKVPAANICLRDGDDVDREGYEGMWSLKASSNNRVTVKNRDNSPLTEDDEVLYPGCWVNMIIGFWVQNNAWGKKVNANLYGVQFVADDEEFGSGRPDVDDVFEDVDVDTEGL